MNQGGNLLITMQETSFLGSLFASVFFAERPQKGLFVKCVSDFYKKTDGEKTKRNK